MQTSKSFIHAELHLTTCRRWPGTPRSDRALQLEAQAGAIEDDCGLAVAQGAQNGQRDLKQRGAICQAPGSCSNQDMLALEAGT